MPIMMFLSRYLFILMALLIAMNEVANADIVDPSPPGSIRGRNIIEQKVDDDDNYYFLLDKIKNQFLRALLPSGCIPVEPEEPERDKCENDLDFRFWDYSRKDCSGWARKGKNCNKLHSDGKKVRFYCPEICNKKCFNK